MVNPQAHLNDCPQVLSRVCGDVDELIAILRLKRPDAQVDLLSLDPFEIHIDQADFGGLNLIFAETNLPVHYTAERRPGFIHFSTDLSASNHTGFLHGQPINSDRLWSFAPNRCADTIIKANSYLTDVQIPRDLFEATCEAMRRNDLDGHFLRTDLLYSPATLRVFQSYLRELHHLIRTNASLLKMPEYRPMIIGDLVPILIDAIPRQSNRALPVPAPNRRQQLAQRARDFIQAHLDQPITLRDIYTALGTSRRTLYYSFESIFEMTPIEYLKTQRLLRVWRSLKQADPNTASVIKIANQWGFWNRYHFSKAYQAQFGELPSETLRKL